MVGEGGEGTREVLQYTSPEKERPLLLSENVSPGISSLQPRRRPSAVRDDATTSQILHGGDVSRPPELTENQQFLSGSSILNIFTLSHFNITRLAFFFFVLFSQITLKQDGCLAGPTS